VIWRPLFSPRPIEIGTAFEIEQIQTSPWVASGGLFEAETAFQTALVTGALSTDAAKGSDAPFDPRIHALRPHRGQRETADALRALLAGSAIRASHLIDDKRIQDPYCLRCQPQVMGAVLDVLRQGAKTGQPIILYRAANNDPAEDFTVTHEGTVHEYYKAGLVSSGLNLHYSSLEAYQFEYAPNGAGSGLCMGVATTAGQGTPVSLQPCGNTARVLWVADTYDLSKGYVPLINGSDTNFSNPYVLNYQGNSYPTDMPRPQLTVHTLSKYSSGTVFNNQMWGFVKGVLP